jgi:very-short-patch-repair endonuclease
LLALGFSSGAIRQRLARGRLHPLERGVYAVGRPDVSREGASMAAVLACGPTAVLSHETAAALWEIRAREFGLIEVSVVAPLRRRRRGMVVHRRSRLTEADVTRYRGIPVTTPVRTLVDLACRLPRGALEAAINEATALDLTDPEALRAALDRLGGEPGVAVLRETLDRRTFRLTDSRLERRFLPLVRSAGLPMPESGRFVDGFKVDFFWPELGLVVETDSLRFHRTPAQQARDRLRDQAHVLAGRTPLRFTHAQVRYEPAEVTRTLALVAQRLRQRSRG